MCIYRHNMTADKLTTPYHIMFSLVQGTVDEYNQAVAKGVEAWKSWREVCLTFISSVPIPYL